LDDFAAPYGKADRLIVAQAQQAVTQVRHSGNSDPLPLASIVIAGLVADLMTAVRRRGEMIQVINQSKAPALRPNRPCGVYQFLHGISVS
jgi:hypothetical protein